MKKKMKMIFEELIQRELVKQSNNFDKVKELLDNENINFYIGFDPTAPSLHVGHLLQILTAKRLKEAGHHPIILIGGATASIGDPTGKSLARQLLSLDQTYLNSINISKQITNILGDSVQIINNIEWFHQMNYLNFVSEIGKYFSVNHMLRAECFKSRMETGLSFLEFNYMLMQAFDFLNLYQQHNCVLQIGGDDQWSNILAGTDLIHKKIGKESFGLTTSLLTNSANQKMGKTEKGTIWLDPTLTSPFDFFQFWRNLPDNEVEKCYKLLTFLHLEEIENMDFSSSSEINNLKKRLAFNLTKLVHGKEIACLILNQAETLFENKNDSMMESMIIIDGTSLIDLLIKCKFAKSKTDARNLINGKGIYLNNKNLSNSEMKITITEFGSTPLILRKGKKSFKQIEIKTL